jgi:nucleoside-diphosphate-sugar epimerase/predicted dehydrogenase
LLQTQPDVVHVLTPPSFHADNVLQALDAGCHVFVEKPLATNVADCDRILEKSSSVGRNVCVGHSLLRDPFIVRATELVRRGTIGSVVGMDHFRSQSYPPYAGGPIPYQYQDGGFPFRDLGVHSLYLMESLLGSVEHAETLLGPASRDGCPLFKDWRVVVRCARGSGHIYFSWEVTPPQDLLVIHGTKGVIRVDLAGMSLSVRKIRRMPGALQRIFNTANEGRMMMTSVVGSIARIAGKKLRRYHGVQELIAEFYGSLRVGADPPVTVAQARRIVEWTERIAGVADQAKRKYLAQFWEKGSAKVLLTGATGFIGQPLLRQLLADKGRVRVIARHRLDSDLMKDDRLEVFLGNLGNSDEVDRAVAGVSEVYHLGATVEGAHEDYQCATVAGTQNIVDSCLRHHVDKLVYLSSLSVLHAAATNGTPIDEQWPLDPNAKDRGGYSQSKLEAEQIVTDAVATRGLRAIILRPGEVVGPSRPFLSGAVGIETAKRIVVLGNGRHTLPLIWIDDLIDAIMAAGAAGSFDGTILHLVDPDYLTQDQIAHFYLQATAQDKKVVHAPLPLIYAAAYGADRVFSALGKSAPLTPYRLKSALGTRVFDCRAAAEQLAWQPRVGVRRGLQQMVQERTHAN